MSQLDQKAAEFLDRINQAAPKLGDAALAAAQMNGLIQVVVGFCFAAATVWVIGHYRRVLKNDAYPDAFRPESHRDFYHIMMFMLMIIPGAIAVLTLFNPWNWVAIYAPEIWLVDRLLYY